MFSHADFPFAAVGAEMDRDYPRAVEAKTAFLKHLDRLKVPHDVENRARETDLPGRLVENVSITTERKGNGPTDRVRLLIVWPVEGCGR
jgi:hypothetical protein